MKMIKIWKYIYISIMLESYFNDVLLAFEIKYQSLDTRFALRDAIRNPSIRIIRFKSDPNLNNR
jgi:hypothetical protein